MRKPRDLLAITADAGARIRLLPGALDISGVPAGSSVSLSGLEADYLGISGGQPVHVPVPVTLSSNAGPISLRDCLFSAMPDTGAAVLIDGGTRVVMSDCTLLGQTAIDGEPEATLLVLDSELYASRCSFTGLVGEVGTFLGNLSGGPGGAGVLIRDSLAVLDECVITGGARGMPFEWLAGQLVVQPGAARGLAVPSPAREFEPFTLNVTGDDGELVFALMSMGAQPLYDSGSHLMVYGAAPLKVRFLGSLPDVAAVQLVMPAIPTVVEGVVVRMQAAFVAASTQVHTSGGLDVVVLDSAF